MRRISEFPNIIKVNEDLVLRRFTEEDKDEYIKLQKAVSEDKNRFNDKGLVEILWYAMTIDNHLEYAVELSGRFVGTVMIKEYDDNTVELGYDVHPDYQNQGICQMVLSKLLNTLKLMDPPINLLARVTTDNKISMHIIDKLGGIVVKNESLEIYEKYGVAIPEDKQVIVYRLL